MQCSFSPSGPHPSLLPGGNIGLVLLLLCVPTFSVSSADTGVQIWLFHLHDIEISILHICILTLGRDPVLQAMVVLGSWVIWAELFWVQGSTGNRDPVSSTSYEQLSPQGVNLEADNAYLSESLL